MPVEPAAGRLSAKLTKPVAVLLDPVPEPVVPLPEVVLPLFVLPVFVLPEVVLPVLVLGAVLVVVPLLLVLLVLLPLLPPPPQADNATETNTEIAAALLIPFIARLRIFLAHPKFPGEI